jgi:hypothetical protein
MGAVFLWSGNFHDRNNAISHPQVMLSFLAMWALASTLILYTSAGLKRVCMDERQLYVSNYVQEIDIPFSAIVDVRQNFWLNFRPITIFLRETTEFGDRVTFMPKQRIRLQFWRVDPIVTELNQLAGLAE